MGGIRLIYIKDNFIVSGICCSLSLREHLWKLELYEKSDTDILNTLKWDVSESGSLSPYESGVQYINFNTRKIYTLSPSVKFFNIHNKQNLFERPIDYRKAFKRDDLYLEKTTNIHKISDFSDKIVDIEKEKLNLNDNLKNILYRLNSNDYRIDIIGDYRFVKTNSVKLNIEQFGWEEITVGGSNGIEDCIKMVSQLMSDNISLSNSDIKKWDRYVGGVYLDETNISDYITKVKRNSILDSIL